MTSPAGCLIGLSRFVKKEEDDEPAGSPSVPQSIFPTAEEDAKLGNTPTAVPQTEHPAYRLAFQDADFLLREDLRPVRFQLELMKPEVLLAEADIHSTFVFYGSARIPSPEEAPALIAAAETRNARPSLRAWPATPNITMWPASWP